MQKIFFLGLISLAFLGSARPAAALGDLVGGWDGTTQTMGHCGLLPVPFFGVIDSDLGQRVAQTKLHRLGYYQGGGMGAMRGAIQRFQADFALRVTGQLDAQTVQRLALESHPIPHVHRCDIHMSSSQGNARTVDALPPVLPFAYQSHP